MPPVYTYDHIHLRTTNPQATIEFYQKMFDATPVAYVQSNGKPRVDLDLNGLTIFIAEVPADASLPTAPSEPYIGLDHLGLRVEDVDAATAELKRRGAQVIVEPKTIRPGVRIAFIQGPDNVRIELRERTVIEVSEAARPRAWCVQTGLVGTRNRDVCCAWCPSVTSPLRSAKGRSAVAPPRGW